jgi:hypothetical protein
VHTEYMLSCMKLNHNELGKKGENISVAIICIPVEQLIKLAGFIFVFT